MKSDISFVSIILISCIPLIIHGLFSPFSKTYLVLSYSLFIIVNFCGFMLVTSQKKTFYFFYILFSAIIAILAFSLLSNYQLVISIFFITASIVSFVFRNKVELKELRNVLIAQQAFYFIIMSLTTLNLNKIFLINKTYFQIVGPSNFLNIGIIALFGSYVLFSTRKSDHVELGRKGIYGMFGSIIIISIGLFDIFISRNLPFVAGVCGFLGWIVTPIFLTISYWKLSKKT